MAAAVHTDFKIYPEQLHTGFNETLNQVTGLFNDASGGAITMVQDPSRGYFEHQSFFKAVSGLVTRRDLTADPVSAITNLALTQDENIWVKLHRKIGPVTDTRGMFRSIMRDPGEFSVLIGEQAAKAALIDQLNASLRAAVAALSGTAGLTHNVTAASPTDTISTDNLIQALAKAGDSHGGIVLWVMHSISYFKLLRDQISTHSFDAVAGVNIATGSPVTLGRPVLVTDSPALYTSAASPGAPTYVLGLRRGAISCKETELGDMVVDEVTGGEQLAIRVQGEFAYSVNVMGYKWDTTTAGANAINPVDSVLGTSSNWDASVTNDKDRAGVVMVADPA